MSTASDPSLSRTRRSRIAGFASPPYQLRPGFGQPTTSYESFLAVAQHGQGLENSGATMSPSLTKRYLCGLTQDNNNINMAYSLDSTITARSIATTGSVEAAALLPSLVARKSPKPHKRLLRSAAARAQSRSAQRINDAMVYLEGPAVYCCGECSTHLTTRDDIISKSFHGRHGRAFLLDSCVNVTIGPAEDRPLMTGLHSVCDIFCKRCNTCVGWTYIRAYELSQKYKEGKFIVETIYLHSEDDDDAITGSRSRSWRKERSSNWGSTAMMDSSMGSSYFSTAASAGNTVVYE